MKMWAELRLVLVTLGRFFRDLRRREFLNPRIGLQENALPFKASKALARIMFCVKHSVKRHHENS